MTEAPQFSLSVSEDTWWTIFGAVLAIIGCIFQAIGFIVQKIGHNQIEIYNKTENKKQHMLETNVCYDADEEMLSAFEDDGSETKSHRNHQRRHKKKKRRYIQNQTWLIGFFLNGIIGSLLNIIALNYAPQSVVLPLSATTLVGNTILATKYLNEPFPVQDVMGVSLVIFGSIGTIIVGPKQSHHLHIDTVLDLKSYWVNPVFLVFFLFISFLISLDCLILKVFDGINKRKKAALIADGNVYFEGNVISEHSIVHMSGFYLISYPLIAAYFASVNFLVLKSFVQIISASIRSKQSATDNFTFWLTYIYILGILIINFLLEMFRQRGLRAFGALYVIPIYQVLVITIGTTMGAIYFNEMAHMKAQHSILFVCSVLVTTCGVIILGLSNKIGKWLRDTNCKQYLFNISKHCDDPQHKRMHTKKIINSDFGLEAIQL